MRILSTFLANANVELSEKGTTKMPLDFDPNKLKKQLWSTYILYRSPQFKLHDKRAYALNAISLHDHSPFILFKWEDGQWVEICREDERPKKSSHCENCGINLQKTYSAGIYSEGKLVWAQKNTDHPIRITACEQCARFVK